MPSVQVDEIEHAMNDNEVISELEHVMSDWGAALTEVMQREAEKHPIGTGPLAGRSFFLCHLPDTCILDSACCAELLKMSILLSVHSIDCFAWPAEIEFWRVRNAAFSSLYEQLNLPSVKKYVSVLEAGSADQNLLMSFKAQFSELKKVNAMWHSMLHCCKEPMALGALKHLWLWLLHIFLAKSALQLVALTSVWLHR